MYDLSNEFTYWLLHELEKRDWCMTQLAYFGGFSSSTLSRILSGERKAGIKVATKIANALNLPHELVFRKAGLLPSSQGENE